MTGQKRLMAFISTTLVCFFALSACEKDDPEPTTPTCDVRGTYSGTSLSSTGNTASMVYRLQDNNFATGGITLAGPTLTFGGYRSTCDSVILSVYYTSNSSYYLLQGKFSNGNATLSGTYKNLTTPADFGTFTISK